MKEYEYDVYMSFTGANRDLKNEIAAYMDSHGLKCYDSDAYCNGKFKEDYCEALDKSRVFLLVLTDNLRNDPNITQKGTFTEVRREIDLAFELEAYGQLNVTIINTSEFFRFAGGYHDYRDKIGWFFYTATRAFSQIYADVEEDGTLGEKTLSELYYKCNRYVLLRNAGQPEPSQAVHFEISENKLSEIKGFTGREAEIEGAIELFASGKQTVVLSGMGGMGKTCLATEIARRCESRGFLQCPQIVRVPDVSGTSGGGLASVVSAVSYEKHVYDALKPLTTADRYERKMRALCELPEYVLLVIDNFNAVKEADVDELLSKLKCRVLITTRSKTDFSGELVGVVRVEPLERKVAYEMFVKAYGSEVNGDSFGELYDEVGGHTITLCIVAKMMREHGLGISEILSELSGKSESGAKVEFVHNDSGESETVFGHLEKLFGMSDFDDECKKILLNMSILSDGTLNVKELSAALGLKNRNAINKLVQGGWLDSADDRLVLHPVLATLTVRLLVPTPENTSEMINYLISTVDEAANELTYADANGLCDKLYYACYTLAGGSGAVCKPLWERFTKLNHLLGDWMETEVKTVEIASKISDDKDAARILAYGDMVTIELNPTRMDIIDKYVDRIESNAEDYKWLLRALSITFRHVVGIKKHKERVKRAVYKALEVAMERRDDFALCDLISICLAVGNKKEYFGAFSKYVKARKKELDSERGDFMLLEVLYYNFILSDCKTASDWVEFAMSTLADITDENYKSLLGLWFKHPIVMHKIGVIADKRINVLSDGDEFKGVLLASASAGYGLAFDGEMDLTSLAKAAVELHFHKMQYGTSLAGADSAVRGIISLFGNVPRSQGSAVSGELTSSIDLMRISVRDLSNLQIASIINQSIGDEMAITQSETVVKAVRKLRPRGHVDVITALIGYGDVCAAFNRDNQAFIAYNEAYELLRETDPDSQMLGETALKLLVRHYSTRMPVAWLDSLYASAISGQEWNSFRYVNATSMYAFRLYGKLLNEKGFATDKFDGILDYFRKIAAPDSGLSGSAKMYAVQCLSEIGNVYVMMEKLDEVKRVQDILSLFFKTKGLAVSGAAKGYSMNLDSAVLEKNGESALENDLKIVKYCIKKKTGFNIAVFAAKRLLVNEMKAELNGGSLFYTVDKYVRKKKRQEEIAGAIICCIQALEEIAGKEIEFADAVDMVLQRITKIDWMPLDLGIDKKLFSKMRSADMLFFLVMQIMISHVAMLLNEEAKAAVEARKAAQERAARGEPKPYGRRLFPKDGNGVSGNAPCPCGSGKKYKNCCGKDLFGAGSTDEEPKPLTDPTDVPPTDSPDPTDEN